MGWMILAIIGWVGVIVLSIILVQYEKLTDTILTDWTETMGDNLKLLEENIELRWRLVDEIYGVSRESATNK